MTITQIEAKYTDELERHRHWKEMAASFGVDIVENEQLAAARRDRALAAVEDELG